MAFDQALRLAEEGNPNDLGYPWIDPSTGELVVSAATAHGRALLESTSFGVPVRIRDVAHTSAELQKIQDDATRLYAQGVPDAVLIYETGPDFRDNRTWITIARFSRPLLDELARRFPPDALVVVVDPTRYPLQGTATPDTSRLHKQAQAALARWTDAVAAAGGRSDFAPVGELTGQVGDWEEAVGGNNKIALMSGVVEAAVSLPAETPPDGEVRWQNGSIETVRLMSAQQALSGIRADGAAAGPCPDCVPLQITGARLTSGSVETSRGPAEAPVWEFSLQGTEVRVTRVAVADRVTVVPPPWDPNNSPVGISIDSATGTVGGRQLTVTFTGAPGTGDQACGADYTAEAVELSTAVVVIVIEHSNGLPVACSAVGARRTAEAQLSAPLGGRAVLEVQEGRPVPVLLTP